MLRGSRSSGTPRGVPLLGIGVALVAAAPALGLSASLAPPYIEKLVRPDHAVSDTIAYTNQGSEPVIVTVSVVDFEVGEANDVIELPPGTSRSSLAPYLRITPTTAQVAGGERVFFRYTAKPPAEAEHLRAMIFFLTRPDLPAPSAPRVVLASRMGVPIYVESTRTEPARLRVESLAWERSAENPDHVVLRVALHNEGGRIFRPSGSVEVRGGQGAFYEVFPFNDGRIPVLPHSTARLEMTLGPLPADELLLKLRAEESVRTSWLSEQRLPASGS